MRSYKKCKFRKIKNKKTKTKKYKFKRQTKKNKYGGAKSSDGVRPEVAAKLSRDLLPQLRYILQNNLHSLDENYDTYILLKDIKKQGILDKKLLNWAENQKLNKENMKTLLNKYPEYHKKQLKLMQKELIDVLKNDLPENIKWSTEQHRPTFSKESNSYDKSKTNWSIINRGIPGLANVTNKKALELIYEMDNEIAENDFINLVKKEGLEKELDHLLAVYKYDINK